MATAPTFEREPIRVKAPGYRNDRYNFSPNGEAKLDFGSEEEPLLVDTPKGASELLLQERRCGDFYAELTGPIGGRSAVGPTPIEAFKRAAKQVRA